MQVSRIGVGRPPAQEAEAVLEAVGIRDRPGERPAGRRTRLTSATTSAGTRTCSSSSPATTASNDASSNGSGASMSPHTGSIPRCGGNRERVRVDVDPDDPVAGEEARRSQLRCGSRGRAPHGRGRRPPRRAAALAPGRRRIRRRCGEADGARSRRPRGGGRAALGRPTSSESPRCLQPRSEQVRIRRRSAPSPARRPARARG